MSEERRDRFWSERLKWEALRRGLRDRRVPSHAGWLHTLGSVSLLLLLVLVGTGVLLSLNYAPAPDHAYRSVRYIETEVTLGSFVRGLHHWASTLLVIAVALHLLHSFVSLAFRRPREITWVTGTLLFAVVLAFAFTGYLLPWDEKAYWATVVGTGMVEQFPLAGGLLLSVVRGGAEVGAATLSRFYGTHVTLLPILLLLLAALHLYLVVVHGIAERAPRGRDTRRSGDTNSSRNGSVPFWPDMVAKDTAAVLLTLGALLFLALVFGAPLEAPADPTNTAYTPRPEWYFLPLFQLLVLFPGSLEWLGAVGVPIGLGIALLLLPWWTRPLMRRRWGRPALLGGAAVTATAVVALGAAAAGATGSDSGGEPAGVSRGRQLYEQLGCVSCHTIRGVGGVVGPDLTLIGLRRPDTAWLAEHLREPAAVVSGSPMPAFPLEGERLTDLVAYLASLGSDLRYTAEAEEWFRSRCQPCHQLLGEGGTFGPNLDRIGKVRTVAFMTSYAEQPTAYNRYARMPPAVGLTPEQLENVVRYVAATALAQPDPLGSGGTGPEAKRTVEPGRERAAAPDAGVAGPGETGSRGAK